MLRYIFTFLTFCLCIFITPAVNTLQQAFDNNFYTLRAIANDDFFSPLVIRLGSNDHITFSFDEISEEPRQLQCRLIHCNADWQPSSLLESEYLQSFNYDDIEDYGFSSNTFVHYINYSFTIPGPHLDPLVSGNYLLQVYDRYEPDQTLLQFRFAVSENVVPIAGEANGRTDKSYNQDLQQLSFALIANKNIVPNPYQDLKISVSQNRRPDTERIIDTPFRVEKDKIIYQHNNLLIFPAGNEYRRFEIVRNDYPGMNIDNIEFGGSNYHAWISKDEIRYNYSYDSTQHGRFFIREHNSTDSDLGADYFTVHFSLDYPDSNADIFLDGDFTNHLHSNRFKLDKNPDTGLFFINLPLKQGAYNYQFLLRSKDGKFLTAPIESNHFETKNEYEIKAFLRTPGSRADRLISTAIILSE